MLTYRSLTGTLTEHASRVRQITWVFVAKNEAKSKEIAVLSSHDGGDDELSLRHYLEPRLLSI